VRLLRLHKPADQEEDMTRDPMTAKSVRVPDALWKQAQTVADERGEVLSEVIRLALVKYVKKRP